ncbi:MAG: hypothetical protein ABEI98_07235 [Halorhabdus sp.]
MQRRAAAMYVVLFAIVGAGAYGLIVTTSAPQVSVDAPTYQAGDTLTFGDRTYTFESASKLTWTNESGELTAQLDNASTVPAADVVWEGQQARRTATIQAGDTIAFDGGQYEVSINASAPSVTLTNVDNASINSTFAPGDTLTYRGNDATVASISSNAVTLVWGGPYMVVIPNATAMENVSQPPNFTLVEQRNLTALATEDPALYNETVVIDGVRHVTYRANNTNVPVTEYFGTVERETFQRGDTLRYQGNETTVESITTKAVTLAWTGPTTDTIRLTSGSTFTQAGTEYLALAESDSKIQVFTTNSEYYQEYTADKERIDSYNTRMLGLWGIVDISIVAVIILLGTALMPVRG